MRRKHEQEPVHTFRHPSWLLTGFWVCVVIALGVVARRLLELAHPAAAGNSQTAAINVTFSSHATLTILHIVPAAIFVILAVRVLLTRTTEVWQRLFFVFGAITGITAYAMSIYAVGGWVERSAVLVFDTWFLFSLACAYLFYIRRDAFRKRQWMTRAVGILLGIATTRPVMGVFFATSHATHLTPRQFFGIAFWIGFAINAIVIELWLHSKRRTQLQQSAMRTSGAPAAVTLAS